MNNIIYRILGCMLILWGISICLDPIQYSSRFGITFDYSDINKPLGLFIVIWGGIFLWSTFKKK